MGRGDIRSRKGKIAAGSYGNSRPAKLVKSTAAATEEKPAAKAKKTASKKKAE